MSCGQIALKELGIDVAKYYASEIDKNAIKVTQDNFPDTIQLGDVTEIDDQLLSTLPKVDLVIFGSPCRSLSKTTAGRKKYNNGLKGSSWLFYPCNNILQWIKQNNNPDVQFMVENVESNRKADLNEMTALLDVEPILIDSAWFSAQERKRNYWTNIPLQNLPKKNSSVLADIMDSAVLEKYYYKESFDYHGIDKKICATLHINGHDIIKRVNSPNYKCSTLTSCRGGNHQKKTLDHGKVRKLTPHEYRKLQTIPEWVKMNVADTHIYNMCGDGWTIEVIKFIFNNLKHE